MRLRELGRADLDEVVRLDALHTGEPKPAYWQRVFRDFLGAGDETLRIGLAAERAGGEGPLIGYLLGEVRAFEFGSEPCGWIFAVGVDPAALRDGVASRLLDEACARFARAGVRRIRTMVRRDSVPVMSFFRANGFVGGAFVQLERDLEEPS